MNRTLSILIGLCLPLAAWAQDATVSSPDNRLRVDVAVKEGKPVYGVTYQSATILEDSPLGFVANVCDFTR